MQRTFVDGECCVRLSLSMVEPCRYIQRLCRLVTSSPGSFSFIDSPQLTISFGLHYSLDARSVGRRHVWEWIAVDTFNTSVRRSVWRLCLHLHWPTLFIDQTRAPMNDYEFAKKAKAVRNWPLPQSQLTAHEVSSDLFIVGTSLCCVPSSLCVDFVSDDFVVVVWFCFSTQKRTKRYALMEGCGIANETD